MKNNNNTGKSIRRPNLHPRAFSHRRLLANQRLESGQSRQHHLQQNSNQLQPINGKSSSIHDRRSRRDRRNRRARPEQHPLARYLRRPLGEAAVLREVHREEGGSTARRQGHRQGSIRPGARENRETGCARVRGWHVRQPRHWFAYARRRFHSVQRASVLAGRERYSRSWTLSGERGSDRR